MREPRMPALAPRACGHTCRDSGRTRRSAAHLPPPRATQELRVVLGLASTLGELDQLDAIAVLLAQGCGRAVLGCVVDHCHLELDGRRMTEDRVDADQQVLATVRVDDAE